MPPFYCGSRIRRSPPGRRGGSPAPRHKEPQRTLKRSSWARKAVRASSRRSAPGRPGRRPPPHGGLPGLRPRSTWWSTSGPGRRSPGRPGYNREGTPGPPGRIPAGSWKYLSQTGQKGLKKRPGRAQKRLRPLKCPCGRACPWAGIFPEIRTSDLPRIRCFHGPEPGGCPSGTDLQSPFYFP